MQVSVCGCLYEYVFMCVFFFLGEKKICVSVSLSDRIYVGQYVVCVFISLHKGDILGKRVLNPIIESTLS